MMTVGVRVLAADPGASKLFTAALTLSSERPGGREGEEGSSRPRGFFGLGGATSDEVVTGGAATEEDEATRGMEGPVSMSPTSSSPAGCSTLGSIEGGGGLSMMVRGGSGSPEPQIS